MTEASADLSGCAALAAEPGSRVYVRPAALVSAADDGPCSLPLAGGRLRFCLAEVIVRAGPRIARTVLPAAALPAAAATTDAAFGARVDERLALVSGPRPDFAGVALDRPSIMAIVNVTPDSFSDGGDFADPAAAVERLAACREAGADVLDIGAESTRPFAPAVGEAEELARLAPVFACLATLRPGPVSVDTRRAGVMTAGLDAGATIINDVSALADDPQALPVAAARGAAVVLMHRRGDAATMQIDPRYDDVALDVFDHLEDRIAVCEAAGLPRARLLADPGIGFGKTLEHNVALLRSLTLFHGLGCGLLLGVSRKGWLGRLTARVAPKERMPGSVAAAFHAWSQGVQMVRAHDVAETAQARAVWEALNPTG